MDLIETINQRKSIRDFKPDPIERDVLKQILEIAVKAPSGVNSQPWEFAVITGEPLQKLKEENIHLLHNSTEEQSRSSDYFKKGSVYKKRQVDLAIELFKLMDIQREDTEKRMAWLERGYRYFNAPAAIILLSDKSIEASSARLMDIGAVMYGICLAAMTLELGTCIEAQGSRFEEPLRKYGNIPDSKNIHVAIAVGRPNWDFPANRIESSREAVDNLTVWSGFDS